MDHPGPGTGITGLGCYLKLEHILVSGTWSLVTGFRFLDSGRWSLVTGHWSLVASSWSLVTGHWSLVASSWSLVTGRWHLVAHLSFLFSGHEFPVREDLKDPELPDIEQ
jgi:hypothetical protein